MNDLGVLRNSRVLVIEDEPLIAMALVDELERADAFVVGPATSIHQAIALLNARQVDAAILDLGLQGELACVVADLLMARGVPFILTTGHDAEVLPPRLAHIPNSPKPALAADVVVALVDRIAGRPEEEPSAPASGMPEPADKLPVGIRGA